MIKLDKIQSVFLRKENLLEIIPKSVTPDKEFSKTKKVRDLNLKNCIKVSINSDKIGEVAKFFLT
jgi:hypothetical protein